jgi:hypothetical protein
MQHAARSRQHAAGNMLLSSPHVTYRSSIMRQATCRNIQHAPRNMHHSFTGTDRTSSSCLWSFFAKLPEHSVALNPYKLSLNPYKLSAAAHTAAGVGCNLLQVALHSAACMHGV